MSSLKNKKFCPLCQVYKECNSTCAWWVKVFDPDDADRKGDCALVALGFELHKTAFELSKIRFMEYGQE